MTRQEAIRHLHTYSTTMGSGQTSDEQHNEAKRMAIEALSADAVQGWIPCSERLPEVGRAVLASGYYNDVYIATLKEDKREEYYWSAFGGFPVMFSAVDAWMPLPKPYKGGDSE